MGGNLFKLGRLPREQYLALEGRLCQRLDARLAGLYRIPRYYGDKPDFGDVDVIVSDAALTEGWEALREELVALLGVERHKQTGHVFSTVFEDFQVDFFCRPAESFEATWAFLCFNDVGNLLGKIFRRLGLKYGEHGLSYVYRGPGESHFVRELLVSRDTRRIFEFVQVDFERWDQGFGSLDEVFEWVIASPYFSTEPYEALSASTRKRARERPTIQRFLTWIEERGLVRHVDYLDDREGYVPMIAAAFPEAGLPEAIAQASADEAREAAVRERFNGRLVMSLKPELEGQALGEFIRTFKDTFGDFEQEVLALDEVALHALILAHEVTPSPSA